MRINEEIGEWMDENCPNGNPKLIDKTKNIASLYFHDIYLLPSPYYELNNYLFAYFTKVWDVLDDEFIRKGGLAPHNLIKHNLHVGKSQISSTSVNRTRTKGGKRFKYDHLEAKDDVKESLLSSNEKNGDENGEGTIRQALYQSFLGSLLPLEVINLILFYESVIVWYGKGGYSSALCGVGAEDTDPVLFILCTPATLPCERCAV